MPRKKITPLFQEDKEKEKKKPIKSSPDKKSVRVEEKNTPPVKEKKIAPKVEKKVHVPKEVNTKPLPPKPELPSKAEKKVPVPKEVKTKPLPPKPELPPKEEKKSPVRGKKKVEVDPKKIKHKLKVGDRVLVTFLGTPTEGTIIQLSDEGMYKVKSDRGTIFPRAKHSEDGILDRYYPSYIIKVINKK